MAQSIDLLQFRIDEALAEYTAMRHTPYEAQARNRFIRLQDMQRQLINANMMHDLGTIAA